MDSGNSGSMQSSSGGDEEYDSRAESISALINNPPPPSHVGAFSTSTNLSGPHPSAVPHAHMYFDPSSNYLDPIQGSPSLPNPNSLLNLDMMWSKPARSEPNPSDLGGLILCSSSSPQNQAFLSSQLVGQNQTSGAASAAFLATHHPLPSESGSRGGLVSVSAAKDQAHGNTNTNTANSNAVRNPKKRPRASRRAPTTVLTTDTTNFRAMVQEFTGIPAQPFTSSSFPRSRLDLFGPAASSTVRSVSTNLDPPSHPYLLRPFAQKLHPPHPFSPSSSMVDTLASNNSTNSATNSTATNYQLFSSSSTDHLGLLKQPLNVGNMHNSILSFQTILQATPKYPLGKSSVLASKTQPNSLEIPLKMGVLEELGLRYEHVDTNIGGLHQTMVSSSLVGALSRGNNNLSNPSTQWAQRTGIISITNNDCDNGGVLRSLNGTGSYSNIPE